MCIQVNNEIGQIKEVLVQKPRENTLDYYDGNLTQIFSLRANFNAQAATEEHRNYRSILEKENIAISYVDELLVETLNAQPSARDELIHNYAIESGAKGAEMLSAIEDTLKGIESNDELVSALLRGMSYSDSHLLDFEENSLASVCGDLLNPSSLFVNPLSTMWFTRDPLAIIGNGITLHHMYLPERNREVSLYQTIFKYHPKYACSDMYYSHNSSYYIEGGDVLNLTREAVIFGISQRTEAAAIDVIACNLLWNPNTVINEIYAIRVPEEGHRIHLDTYLTQVDYDKFLVDPALTINSEVYKITRGNQRNTVVVSSLFDSLQTILSKALKIPSVQFIECGDGIGRIAEREGQGNAISALCLKPGRLCVYEHNKITNRALEKAGIDLIPIEINELTSGFGGPNCLSLPLCREDI